MRPRKRSYVPPSRTALREAGVVQLLEVEAVLLGAREQPVPGTGAKPTPNSSSAGRSSPRLSR